jgi:hypothetical protein
VRRYERAELDVLMRDHGFEVLRLHHWGFPFGLLYERCVQRPVLQQQARRGAVPGVAARLGRQRLVNRVAASLFEIDRCCDGASWGPGLLLVARRLAA